METIVGTDCWQFRLSRPWAECHEPLKKLIEGCDGFVAYEHTHDNEVSRTHIHGVIVGCKWGEDTIRTKYLRKICPDKSDNMLSRTYKDKATGQRLPINDKSFVYMSKGQYFMLQKGFNDDFLEACRAAWVPPASKKVTKTVLEKQATVKKIDMLKEMIELVGDRHYDTEHVLKCIREVLIKYDQVVGMYKLMDFHDSIMWREEKSSFIKALASKINQRL